MVVLTYFLHGSSKHTMLKRLRKNLISIFCLLIATCCLVGCEKHKDEDLSEFSQRIISVLKQAESYQYYNPENELLYQKEVLDVYDKEKHHGARCAEISRITLEYAGVYFCKKPDRPSQADMYRNSGTAYKMDCREPMVVYLWGSSLSTYQKYKEAFQVLQKSRKAMDASRYYSYRKAKYYTLLFFSGVRSEQIRPEYLEKGISYYKSALNENALGGDLERIRGLVYDLTDKEVNEEAKALLDEAVLEMISFSEGHFPEFNALLKMEYYIQKAWKARGGGFAHTVSVDGMKLWHTYMDLAYQAGLQGIEFL